MIEGTLEILYQRLIPSIPIDDACYTQGWSLVKKKYLSITFYRYVLLLKHHTKDFASVPEINCN